MLERRSIWRIGLVLRVSSLRVFINKLQRSKSLKILRPRGLIILIQNCLVILIILGADDKLIPRHFGSELLVLLVLGTAFVQRRLNNVADNLRR